MTTYRTRAERRAALRSRASTLITPKLRTWAYGVTIAALPVAVAVGWLPATSLPILVPLAMALFFVDKDGKPTEGS